MASFTSYQWIVLVLLVVCKFLSTVVWALQAPFYPAEAQKKNASLMESGIVLGSYELMVFVMCPFIATVLPKFGAYRAFHFGFILCALSTICFGFLDKINDRILFVGCSLLLRLLEATGSSAVFLATYMLSNRLYAGSVATVCGLIESTFAVGMAAGPPLGGLLFEFGSQWDFGFTIPFVTVGVLMLLVTMVTCCVLPSDTTFPTESMTEIAEPNSKALDFGFFGLLKIPSVLLYAFAAMAAAFCVGFLTSTLEPHLRPFGLTPFMTGMMFLIYGAVYAATGFLWGMLCDRIQRPEFVTLLGMLLALVSFVFLGPITIIPVNRSLTLVGTSLAVFGLGLGGLYISVYSLILKEAMLHGFPESSKTSSIVAGLWMEGISLGAFLGPVSGGLLCSYFDFPDASLLVIVILSTLGLILTVHITTTKSEIPSWKNQKTKPLPRSDLPINKT